MQVHKACSLRNHGRRLLGSGQDEGAAGSGGVALSHLCTDSELAALGSRAGFVASNSLSTFQEPQVICCT